MMVLRRYCLISLILLAFCLSQDLNAQSTITTVVGGGIPNNVSALLAALLPNQIVGDGAGNLYFSNDDLVYKLASSGVLTLVAGNGTEGFSGDGGPATSASITSTGIAVDVLGNVYIADPLDDRIREIVAATGIIKTIAGNGVAGFTGDGGPATSAELDGPQGLAVDALGNVFLTDGNSRIREVVAFTGNIQTVAGNGTAGFSGDGGPAINAELNGPIALAFDHSGNLFVADSENQRIREILANNQKIQTVAGNGVSAFSGDGGPAIGASLDQPLGVSVDIAGNVFIADSFNERIREVVATTGTINTFAGTGTGNACTPLAPTPPCISGDGGLAVDAGLATPTGVFVDSLENVYIADGNRIREVFATDGIIETVAGNGTDDSSGDGGPATDAQLAGADSVFVDKAGNIFIADGARVRKVDGTGVITTVAGNGSASASPSCSIVDENFLSCEPGQGGAATAVGIDANSVYVDSDENIFIAGGARLWEVNASTDSIQNIAGIGIGYCQFAPCPFLGDGGPATIADIDATGTYVDQTGDIFVTDSGNSAGYTGIREITAGVIKTVAKINGPEISTLNGLAVDTTGDMFVAESGLPNGIVEVLANTGNAVFAAGGGVIGFGGDGGPATSASFNWPEGVFVDNAGNIFIADTYNARVREVHASTGEISTVVGNGVAGFVGDGGPATEAELSQPMGVWGDRNGNLYIADSGNSRIRKVSGIVTVGAPIANIAPSTVSFGSVAVGGNSSVVNIVVTNTGTANLVIGTIPSLGSPFFIISNGCGLQTIAPQMSCTIETQFSPTMSGPANVTMFIPDNAAGSPQTVPLSGTGAGQPVVSVQLNQLSASLSAGQSQQFTATVTGSSNMTVTWSLNPQLGTINQTGLYTAPSSITTQQIVTVTATSAADTTKTASAIVTLIPSPLKSTTTALTSSLNPAVGGQSVLFTATVATASGQPTGSVTFMDGSTSIGSATLNGADVATLSTSTLSVAAHSITAQYSGDANFTGSSASLKEMIVVAAFAPVPPQTLTPGQSITIPLTLYEAAGSGLTFTLSCSGLPAESSCTFNPPAILAGSPPIGTTIQMTLMTTMASGMPAEPVQRSPRWPFIVLLGWLATMTAAATVSQQTNSQRRFALGLCSIAFCLALMIAGCAGVASTSSSTSTNTGTSNAGTPAGPVAIAVTATAGATTSSTVVNVTVQ
jgi:hypothetical protein